MMVGINTAPKSPAELLGDPHPLLEQLGSSDGLAVTSPIAAALQLRRVQDVPALRRFLVSYREQILTPLELPAIVAAFNHAAGGEAKELIALDARLAKEPALRDFAVASCRVGQRQLARLRPLRDQRVVQRYLAAIEAGEARGWHTIVFGVALAMFSLPLRQGLQHYSEQTLAGFVESAARMMRLREAERQEIAAAECAHVPASIAAALAPVSALATPMTRC